MCDECDFETTPDRMSELNRHCLHDHKRRPKTSERTPVPARGGDA